MSIEVNPNFLNTKKTFLYHSSNQSTFFFSDSLCQLKLKTNDNDMCVYV